MGPLSRAIEMTCAINVNSVANELDMGRGLLCAPEEAKRLKKAKQIAPSSQVQASPQIPEQKIAADQELSVIIVAAFRVGIMSALGAAKGPVRTAPAMVNVD